VKFSEGVDVDRPVMVDLTNQAALHSLLIEVLNRAKSNRLQVLSSEAGDSKKRGAFYDQRKSYRLRLRGSYLDYYNLLEDLKQLPYTILIADIDLKKMVGASFLEIQMTILV
jgi:Tfp pilus assembly protein PilO